MNRLNGLDVSHDAQEKLSIAHHLIQCYVGARGGLRELGILRSERNLQGDYAEWLVTQMLNLKLSDSAVMKSVDAEDSIGRTYQVKARIVKSLRSSTSFDFRECPTDIDFFVGVFFDRSFNVLGIIRVQGAVIVECGSQSVSTFRFRWNRTVAADPRVEWLYQGDH